MGKQYFFGRRAEDIGEIQPIGSVRAAYISEFVSAGINQTRHRIYLELSCDVYILMPSGSKRVSVAAQVVVSECLIVGVVPNSYVYVDDTDKMLNLIPD
ncbi:MAG: sporulation protein YunB [Oscillospiraceae bacterium]|nr:MAG: sporulation protein YunB [Oscillospiraceae bacterium]